MHPKPQELQTPFWSVYPSLHFQQDNEEVDWLAEQTEQNSGHDKHFFYEVRAEPG